MDINNDGNPDIISGSWPGEIFLTRGTEDKPFTTPEMIQDKDGKFINFGGGIRKEIMFRPWGGDQSTRLLIAGNAKFEHTAEGTFVNYHGHRLESTPERSIAITGMASAANATDWDLDGNLDLLVGSDDGSVSLYRNTGSTKSPNWLRPSS